MAWSFDTALTYTVVEVATDRHSVSDQGVARRSKALPGEGNHERRGEAILPTRVNGSQYPATSATGCRFGQQLPQLLGKHRVAVSRCNGVNKEVVAVIQEGGRGMIQSLAAIWCSDTLDEYTRPIGNFIKDHGISGEGLNFSAKPLRECCKSLGRIMRRIDGDEHDRQVCW